MDFDEKVRQVFLESIRVKESVLEESGAAVAEMAHTLVVAYRSGGKLLVCGNGGSAADAQHIAAELVGRFLEERAALECIALSTNTSILTALGNDYGFDHVFSRQVEAYGRKGDVLLAISTSGESPNVLLAVEKAKAKGLRTLGLSGKGGGPLAEAADLCVTIPSDCSPRIQEAHITIGHLLCEAVESALSKKGP